MNAAAQVAPAAVTPVLAADPAPPPSVDPANDLTGRPLIEALRKGGYVLYIRHALQIPPTTETCDAPALAPAGEQQARSVGAAIRALQIPIGRILPSEPCRNRDTARLLGLGAFEITRDLNPGGMPPGFDVGAARTCTARRINPSGFIWNWPRSSFIDRMVRVRQRRWQGCGWKGGGR